MSIFVCPKCKTPLYDEGNSLFCQNRHCFDKSKYKYVNLLLQNGKQNHGDNKLMIRSRKSFLDRGYYSHLRLSLCESICKHLKNGVILDAGCGEGYYLDGLLGTPFEYVMPTLTGVIAFALGVLSVMLCVKVGSIDNGGISTVSLLSLMLSSWALLVSSSSKDFLFKGEIRFSNMFVAAFALQVLEVVLFLLIEPFGNVMGVHRIPWICALILFGTFVVTFLLAELLKMLKYVKPKPRSKKKSDGEDGQTKEDETKTSGEQNSEGMDTELELSSQKEEK